MDRTQNLHVRTMVRLVTPKELKAELPMTETANRTVVESRERVTRILRREDPRLLVPKRFRVTGWTMNFAHPKAVLLFAALLAVIIVPITVVEVSGYGASAWARPVTIATSILAVLVLTWWASKLRVK